MRRAAGKVRQEHKPRECLMKMVRASRQPPLKDCGALIEITAHAANDVNSTAMTVAFRIRNVLPYQCPSPCVSGERPNSQKKPTRLSQSAGFVRRIIEDINKSAAK
jgi:hypothetical protein